MKQNDLKFLDPIQLLMKSQWLNDYDGKILIKVKGTVITIYAMRSSRRSPDKASGTISPLMKS